jgi:hypothetical protein
MTYYVGHILMRLGSEKGTLADLIQHHSSGFAVNEIGRYMDRVIRCPPGTQVIGPDDGEIPLKPLSKVYVRAGLLAARQ